MKFLALLTTSLLVTPAMAQSADPHSVLNLRGTCEALIIDSIDRLDICADEIMEVVYTDGTMELAIWTDDPSDRFVVLSGPVRRTEEGALQQVELIIDGKDGSGDNNVDHAASGTCIITGDTMAGAAHIACEAKTVDGENYAFAFQTDGSMPESMLD